MEFFYDRAAAWGRAALIALLLWALLHYLANFGVTYDEKKQLAWISLGAGFVLVSVYDTVIWTRLLDPFKAYPLITARSSSLSLLGDFRELLPITTAPRGVKTLKWMKQNPSADFLRVQNLLNTRLLIPVSPQAHRDILGTKSGDFAKPDGGRAFLSTALGWGLIMAEGDEHKRQRSALTPSFRLQNIKALQGLMSAKVAILVSRLREAMALEGQVEISTWASRLTLDIIGPTLMSKDFRALDAAGHPLEDAYAELLTPSKGLTVLFVLSLFLPPVLWRNVPIAANRMITRATGTIRATCLGILQGKKASLEEKTGEDVDDEHNADILGRIMRSTNFNETELTDQMMTFLGAGHETTATSIAWATHLLTLPKYQHYQVQLRKELESAIGHKMSDATLTDGTLSHALLESLPILNGIAEEVFRLYPPVPTTARRAVRDTELCGLPVAAGTICILVPWAVNRNPKYWGANSEEFVPERWIDTAQDGSARLNKDGGAGSNMAGITFLHGRRACIGQDFAKAEFRVALAALFGLFDVRRAHGESFEATPSGTLTIKPDGGLNVRFIPVQ